MTRPTRTFRSARALALLLAAAAAAASGCATIDDLLGRGGSGNGETLQLQSIEVTSDHPNDDLTPTGAATTTSGDVVLFTATGTFVNVKDAGKITLENVTSAVLWKSSAPAIALPGADGRATAGSSGAVTISASSPAAGDVPALQSNEIVLTVLP